MINKESYEQRKYALEHLIELGFVEYKKVAGIECVELTPLGLQYLGAVEILNTYNTCNNV